MVSHDFFESLVTPPVDEMNALKIKLRSDSFANKIDVSAGVYRDDNGIAYEFPAIRKAKDVLFKANPTHDYNYTVGIKEFNHMAGKITFGDEILEEDRISTCQTISGTGACNLAIKFLHFSCGIQNFYVGYPTWPNYSPMIKGIGANNFNYEYYDTVSKSVNFEEIMKTLKSAEETNSAFVFQACCHNPTGSDLSLEQWEQIADIMLLRKLMPIFDIAYQGLLSGLTEEDVSCLKTFYNKGLQFVVCQSFSKNMGLYGERVGAIHVVSDKAQTSVVQDQVRSIIRREYSSSPAYGARLAILVNDQFEDEWRGNIKDIASTLKIKRKMLYDLLQEYKVAGDYEHLLTQTGMFWFSGFPPEVCKKLTNTYHIYLPVNGRVNIAGVNDTNVEYFVKSLKEILG